MKYVDISFIRNTEILFYLLKSFFFPFLLVFQFILRIVYHLCVAFGCLRLLVWFALPTNDLLVYRKQWTSVLISPVQDIWVTK